MIDAFKAGPDCLPVDQLERGLELPSSSPERRAAEQHVAECSYCQTELALLREFQTGPIRDGERQDVEWISQRLSAPPAKVKVVEIRPRRAPGYKSVAALLAIAAALLIAVNVNWRQTEQGSDTGPDVVRSAPLLAVSPSGEWKSVPDEFRWTSVSGAVRYRLVVSEVDRTVVYEATTPATSATMPASLRTQLAQGKAVQWTVSAEDAQGRAIATSAMQRFSTKSLQN